MVTELARRIGKSQSSVSKHLMTLRKTAAVTKGRGQLYSIAPRWAVSPGVLDFGYGPMTMQPVQAG